MKKIGAAEARKRQKRKIHQKNVASGPGNKSSSFGNMISIIIIIIAIIIACVAGYKLYSIMMDYKAAADEYSAIADTVIHERKADEEEVRELKDIKGKVTKHWTAPFEVDFDELKKINEDVVGWLYMEALPDISYPVVQGDDNEYYLHHTYKKEAVFAGAIFIDMKNTLDFSDQNTIVYGHNMKDGSMFGNLKQYKKQETVDKSPYFWIITPDDAYKYVIFSVYTASVKGDTYTLIKGPGKETITYGNSMKEKSELDLEDHAFVETDKIITLSTCTGNESTRFVVQGVRIDPK